jgi:hypothetical protein
LRWPLGNQHPPYQKSQRQFHLHPLCAQ